MNSKLITVRKGYPQHRFAKGGQISPWVDLAAQDKAANPWNYADDLDTTEQYMNSTNSFGLSKADNPFSKGNMAGGLKSMASTGIGKGIVGAVGGAANRLALKTISGGLNSGAGNAVANIGNTVGGAISKVNPLIGVAVQVGTGIIGGGINAAVGTAVNQQIKAANDAGNKALNTLSYDNSLDNIQGPETVANVENAYRSGFLKKGWAKKRNAAAAQERADAMSLSYRNQENNASNLINNQLSDALSDWHAFGGPLEGIDVSSPIGYSFMNEYINSKQKQNDSSMTNLFAGIPNNMFDIGGILQTNGANYGNTIHINAGDSHENNRYDGVQLGVDQNSVPNLVEEGEIIYNDYVYSNRLTVPDFKKQYKNKKEAPYEAQVLWNYSGKTFADAAKKIEKSTGSDERTEDPIANRGMESMLGVLAGIQEKEREKEKLREQQEAIDNMTPEEFAAMQQQQEAQQQQQEAIQQQAEQQAMQQQQGVQGRPPEEELAMMQQQAAQQQMIQQQAMQGQPMAAYGGKLFKYGGSLAKFTKELQSYGLTVEDYLDYFAQTQNVDRVKLKLTDENFNKDVAGQYLNTVTKTQKQVARVYRKSGKNPSKLQGVAVQKFNEDVSKALKNPELLNNDDNKQLFVNQVGKGDNQAFSVAANNAVVNEARQQAFGNPLEVGANGKFAVNYSRPEGATESWAPQSASIIQNAPQIKDGKWVDGEGNEITNPYEGYGISAPSRDWSTYGYLNPTDNSWTNIEYNPSTDASGNTDFRYAPWNEWFKQSGMDADKYEGQDAYLENYLDFLDDIYNEDSPNHQAALQRLYTMGEATKSNSPGELKGKNRYFDTDRENFNSNNLTLNDIRVVDGYNVIGDRYTSGVAPSRLAEYSDIQFYADKDGRIIGSKSYDEMNAEDKKKYTALPDKGLTRENLINNLRARRNDNYDTDNQDLLFSSMFDNVPAQSYLTAPRTSNRYALVDDNGAYIKDSKGNIQYLDHNVINNPLYSIYNEGNPITIDNLGDTSVNTIGVKGGNYSPHIAVINGKYYNLTPEQAQQFAQYKVDSEKAKQYTGFDTPITGYNVNPTYYDIPEEGLTAAGLGTLITGKEGTNNDTFPEAPTWPYLMGIGLQAGALGYNILKPADYSNANAMISAAQNAGNYNPIEFRPIGDYLTYRPMDIWYEQNRLNANSRATDRTIMNSGAGQGAKNAALLANAYNSQIASGNLYRQALEYNDALRKQVGEFNRGTNQFNSEGFLKADMSNQDAASRARGYTLEGLRSGYAMRQAIDDAKANAISAGISGIGTMLYNMADTNYKNKILGWGIEHGAFAPQATKSKGGRVRRKKGLSF